MELGCLIVCLSLLAQQSPPSPVPPTRIDEPETPAPVVEVVPRKPKLTPPRLVAAALTPPTDDPLPGRPLPLLEVLTRAATRPRQVAAVQAYWTLASAVGEYHFARQEQEMLSTVAASAGNRQEDKLQSAALAAEMALASARVQESQLRAAAARADLADRAGLPATDRQPLPADEPHVGGYRTHFDVLFASRVAPPRMQLLERTLPLRRKAIDVRAEAVQAAWDSLAAAQDALGNREIDVAAVAERVTHLGRQRKAFLDSVRQYNHEIAEYALGTADPLAPPASVLIMLIKPKQSATPAAPERQNSTATSGASKPAEVPRTGRLPGRRSLLKSNREPDADEETRLKPPAAGDELAQLAPPADAEPADYESYPALLGLSPPKRTHRLARLLHWDRSLADASESPLTLEQCLAAVAPADRRRSVEAFWTTREQAARCQVASDQNDQLAALYPLALGVTGRPGGPEAMLDLRARQQAAEADLLDCQAWLWLRRLELATVLGRAANVKDWPLPATAPHGGRYETKLESQPQALAQSPAVQSLAALLPGLYAALEDRAEAVVYLDHQRAATIEALESAARRVDLWPALESVSRQATESRAFLSTLTRYNLSIADYALAILPPAISPPELTSSLVVQTR